MRMACITLLDVETESKNTAHNTCHIKYIILTYPVDILLINDNLNNAPLLQRRPLVVDDWWL